MHTENTLYTQRRFQYVSKVGGVCPEPIEADSRIKGGSPENIDRLDMKLHILRHIWVIN